MMWFLTAGAGFGLAVAVLVRPLLPARPRLSAAMEQMGTADLQSGVKAAEASYQDRIGRWVLRTVPTPSKVSLQQNLALLEISPITHAYQRFLYTALLGVGFLIVGTMICVLIGVPVVLALLIAIVGALAGWLLPDVDVRQKATAAREEFSRAVAVYIELVATEKHRDAPNSVALANAALVSDHWLFRRVSQELFKAQLDHRQPWTVLQEFSAEIGVPELADMAQTMALSGDKGANIYQSLRASGKTLRVKMLNEEHTEANQQSEKLGIYMTFLAFIFIGIIATPPIIDLL